jgi:hypothetical protein
LPFLGVRVTQRSPDSRCSRWASSDPAAQEEIPERGFSDEHERVNQLLIDFFAPALPAKNPAG